MLEEEESQSNGDESKLVALMGLGDGLIVRRLHVMLADISMRFARSVQETSVQHGLHKQTRLEEWATRKKNRVLLRTCHGCLDLLYRFALRYQEAACLEVLLQVDALCWCLRLFAAIYALREVENNETNKHNVSGDGEANDSECNLSEEQKASVDFRLSNVLQRALELVALLLGQGVTAFQPVPVSIPDESRRTMSLKVVRGLLLFLVHRGHALGGLGGEQADDGLYSAALHAFLWVSTQVPDVVVECLFIEDQAVHLGFNLVRLVNWASRDFSLLPCLMMLDNLFASPITADFFFPNDLLVLVPIVVREIGNGCAQSSSAALMPWYLSVLSGIVRNSKTYAESRHIFEEIKSTVSLLRKPSCTVEQVDQVEDGLCSDILQQLDSLQAMSDTLCEQESPDQA